MAGDEELQEVGYDENFPQPLACPSFSVGVCNF